MLGDFSVKTLKETRIEELYYERPSLIKVFLS